MPVSVGSAQDPCGAARQRRRLMARKVGLDHRQVIDAAAKLADAEGVESVTLARVAAALAVASPSLYSYVNGLAALRRELALEASTFADSKSSCMMLRRLVTMLAKAFPSTSRSDRGLICAVKSPSVICLARPASTVRERLIR